MGPPRFRWHQFRPLQGPRTVNNREHTRARPSPPAGIPAGGGRRPRGSSPRLHGRRLVRGAERKTRRPGLGHPHPGRPQPHPHAAGRDRPGLPPRPPPEGPRRDERPVGRGVRDGRPQGPRGDVRRRRPLHGGVGDRPAHHLARGPPHDDGPDRHRHARRPPALVRAGEPRHLRLDRHGRRRGRRGPQPPRLRARHKRARRACRTHPRGGGQTPRRRGTPAHRPRPARRRRPPHRPRQRAGRSGRARHGQAPRPGQGSPRPRPRGQPLRAQRTPRHGRPAETVRRPGGPHRTRPGPAPPRRTRRHLPQRGPARGGGPHRPRHHPPRRRRPGRVPRHPGSPHQCPEARGPRSEGRGQRRTRGTERGDHRPRQRAGRRRGGPAGGERRPRTARHARAGHRAERRLHRRTPIRRRLPGPCDPAGQEPHRKHRVHAHAAAPVPAAGPAASTTAPTGDPA